MALILTLVAMTTVLVAVSGQNVRPASEYAHFDKSVLCGILGYQARQPNEASNAFTRANRKMTCPQQTIFSMSVCSCVYDPAQILSAPKRPYCQRILNVTGTEDLQRNINGHYISYTGDSSNIFSSLESICYRGSYFSIHFMESNDYGNALNLRFSVRFQNFGGTNLNNEDLNEIRIMSNGDCGRNEVPTFRIGYNPSNDTYVFVADRFFQSCRMTPRRSVTNRNLIDNINLRFDNGALSVTINDQLINRSGCSANTGQNIFSAFNYKWKGTVCPLKIGNPAVTNGRVADVCLSSLQMNRDCPAGQ